MRAFERLNVKTKARDKTAGGDKAGLRLCGGGSRGGGRGRGRGGGGGRGGKHAARESKTDRQVRLVSGKRGGERTNASTSASTAGMVTSVEGKAAERLLAAVRTGGSGEGGTTDYSLLPEHWIDPTMVSELVEHARTLAEERAQQGSESGGGGGGASGASAEEATRSAALRRDALRALAAAGLAPGIGDEHGEDGEDDGGGGEGKDTSGSSRENVKSTGKHHDAMEGDERFVVFEEGVNPASQSAPAVLSATLAVEDEAEDEDGDGDTTQYPRLTQYASAAVPWSTGSGCQGPIFALRKRAGRVVKLIPTDADCKGTERSNDGSIILRDETMCRDCLYACSPGLGRCLDAGLWLNMVMACIVGAFAVPSLPFAILKFTNTTEVLFGPRVANTSSATASNTTSYRSEPLWWVVDVLCAVCCVLCAVCSVLCALCCVFCALCSVALCVCVCSWRA